MSDHDDRDDGSLVPAGRPDLAPLAAANPLVARGLADLSKLQLVPKAGDRLLQPSRETGLVEQLGLQTLIDKGKEGGYLTYRQVSDYLRLRVFRIEPDGPVKVLPADAENQERLAQLLVILDEHDIELLDETEVGPDDDYNNARFYYNRGCSWVEKEDYDKAFEDFDASISLDPNFCGSLITTAVWPGVTRKTTRRPSRTSRRPSGLEKPRMLTVA